MKSIKKKRIPYNERSDIDKIKSNWKKQKDFMKERSGQLL
jgi:hypothetical protein